MLTQSLNNTYKSNLIYVKYANGGYAFLISFLLDLTSFSLICRGKELLSNLIIMFVRYDITAGTRKA